MKHPLTVMRVFSKTDEEVLQQSDLKLASFQDNKNLFVDRFPQMADPFSPEWANAITTARTILPDYVSVSNQSAETDVLQTLMEKGRNIFQTLILYTQLAFPGDSNILKSMGQPRYRSAQRSQLKLPVLLKTAYAYASKPLIRQSLLEKGMKVQEIEMISITADDILNQEIIQQRAMTRRSSDATLRIEALNLVWFKMSLVCQCAKLLFQSDATRYNLFLLNDGVTPFVKPEPAPALLDKTT